MENKNNRRMEMSRLGLGFDTGGTYTDAVIMDLDTGEIFERAKSLTTRNDLSIGIKGAIAEFDKSLLSEVVTVCLSSTLATNSIVEGKGCRVGLILIGSQITVSAKVDYSIMIKGSHTATGKVDEPLDVEAAKEFLKSIRGKVDCMAVTGFMSVRNPEHEQEIAALAKEILHVPVVCGYELSSGLGFNERTITCVMNARLIPVIEELIQSVNKVLDEFGIDAPLMIVKGDGSVMSEEMAKIRPVETILSGPASSINGAKKLSGKDNAIVVDIGGTTTDIGIVRDGKPRLDPEGALIGGYRTRVMAAEITTAGMGGDSRIVINGEKVYLSPVRVIPLCVAAWKHPGLRERLQALVDDGPKKIPVAHYARNIVIDTEYFIKVKEMKNADYLTELDEKFLDFVKDEPHSLAEAKRKLKEPPISFNIEKMEELGIIQRIGLTPTDLMHARGCFTKYDAEASKLGIAYHAANLDMTPEEFIAKADYLVTEKIGMEIVKKVLLEDNRETDLTGFGMDLVDKAVTGSHALDYDVSFRLNKPIIGMGGPAYDMLPKVAELLGTELVMPENYDVGNAVGAVSGKVVESIEILIQTATGTTIDNPACTAFSRLGRFYYEKFDDGVVQATEAGKQYVTEMAKKAGAENIKVTVGSDKSEVFVGKEHLRTRFVEIKLIITATGDPAYRKKA